MLKHAGKDQKQLRESRPAVQPNQDHQVHRAQGGNREGRGIRLIRGANPSPGQRAVQQPLLVPLAGRKVRHSRNLLMMYYLSSFIHCPHFIRINLMMQKLALLAFLLLVSHIASKPLVANKIIVALNCGSKDQ